MEVGFSLGLGVAARKDQFAHPVEIGPRRWIDRRIRPPCPQRRFIKLDQLARYTAELHRAEPAIPHRQRLGPDPRRLKVPELEVTHFLPRAGGLTAVTGLLVEPRRI